MNKLIATSTFTDVVAYAQDKGSTSNEDGTIKLRIHSRETAAGGLPVRDVTMNRSMPEAAWHDAQFKEQTEDFIKMLDGEEVAIEECGVTYTMKIIKH